MTNPRPPLQRLLAMVDVDPVTGCWIFTGATITRDRDYGAFYFEGKRHLAHRVSYQLHVGPIPEGHDIHHACPHGANPRCVNPVHLEPLTHRDNLLADDTITARNAAKTHCPQGHAYTPENTYVSTKGKRQCRKCHRAHQRRYKAARSGAVPAGAGTG